MASDRPVLRPQRLALLLLLTLLLALLLEMNRWLPGGWPGGGGSGLRVLDVAPQSEAARLAASEAASADWKPEKGVRLEVRAADGALAAGWRAAVGGRTATDRPEAGAAWLLLNDRDVATEGVRIVAATGQVRHVPPPSVPPAPRWRVQLPTAPLPPLQMTPELEVEVLDALTGTPVAGARVFGPGALAPVPTDASGRAALKVTSDRVEVRVDAAGYLEARAHGHSGTRTPVRVRLSPRLHLRLRLLDPTSGDEARVFSARLEDAHGETLWEAPPGPARSLVVEADLAAERLDGARLVVDAPDRPRTEAALPAAGGTLALAAPGRRIELVLRDAAGTTVPAGAAVVRTSAVGGAAPERERTGVETRVAADAQGRLAVHVPEGVEAQIVVEAPGRAPIALRVDPGDGPGTRELTATAGIAVPVQVLDLRGRPVRDAEVVARCVVEGVRITTRATTDAEGRARVGTVPPGPVEILAHAAGRAWSGAAVEAAPAMATVPLRLAPGGTLRLVVETPIGAPLAGVHVDATPEDEGGADVQPPEPPVWRTRPDGALVIEDLPLRPYRLRLSLPGHVEETLHDVRPGAVVYFATLTPLETPSAPR